MKQLILSLVFIILIIYILFFTFNNDGVIYIDSDTNGECLIKCNNLAELNKYGCNIVSSSFKELLINNSKLNYSCECILIDCLKSIY